MLSSGSSGPPSAPLGDAMAWGGHGGGFSLREGENTLILLPPHPKKEEKLRQGPAACREGVPALLAHPAQGKTEATESPGTP